MVKSPGINPICFQAQFVDKLLILKILLVTHILLTVFQLRSTCNSTVKSRPIPGSRFLSSVIFLQACSTVV